MRNSRRTTDILPRGAAATPVVAIRGYQHHVRLDALRVVTNHRNLDHTLLPDTLGVAGPLPLPACHMTGTSGA